MKKFVVFACLFLVGTMALSLALGRTWTQEGDAEANPDRLPDPTGQEDAKSEAPRREVVRETRYEQITTANGQTVMRPVVEERWAPASGGRNEMRSNQNALEEKILNARRALGSNDESAAAEAKKVLAESLTQLFDMDIANRKAQLEKVKARVAEMEKSLQKRVDAKSEIVKLRIQVILQDAEGLGWTDGQGVDGDDFGPVRGFYGIDDARAYDDTFSRDSDFLRGALPGYETPPSAVSYGGRDEGIGASAGNDPFGSGSASETRERPATGGGASAGEDPFGG